jgi:hypothetical protein
MLEGMVVVAAVVVVEVRCSDLVLGLKYWCHSQHAHHQPHRVVLVAELWRPSDSAVWSLPLSVLFLLAVV